ncbi:MAG TPA: Hsp20/alpha crystallin family protein [Streptosporangiaceae bacterium]|nr:Hsp20/alpha crystallin family protein [Streptosporangiaceae bacterium]
MAGLMRREPRGEVGEFFSRFDHMFDEWARMMPLRAVRFAHWPDVDGMIRIEEFHDDGALVVRADLPGIDPEKDVELTVANGMLHIEAERREEEKKEDKGYLRQELRYGSLSRTLPLPEGVTESDIKAAYKAGILEIRIPEPRPEPAKKIPIAKS